MFNLVVFSLFIWFHACKYALIYKIKMKKILVLGLKTIDRIKMEAIQAPQKHSQIIFIIPW